jgi:hypothetical protein
LGDRRREEAEAEEVLVDGGRGLNALGGIGGGGERGYIAAPPPEEFEVEIVGEEDNGDGLEIVVVVVADVFTEGDRLANGATAAIACGGGGAGAGAVKPEELYRLPS